MNTPTEWLLFAWGTLGTFGVALQTVLLRKQTRRALDALWLLGEAQREIRAMRAERIADACTSATAQIEGEVRP